MIASLRQRVFNRIGFEVGLMYLGAGIILSSFIPSGYLQTGVGISICLVGLFRMHRTDKIVDEFDFMRMGKEGEIAVAEALSVLQREYGAWVFHDVDTGNARIDHVIVHASGVYAVETKTVSRHNEAFTSLRFDGDALWKGKFQCVDNAPRQALRQAASLRDFIRQNTEVVLWTRAILLLPGWDVEQSGAHPNLRVDSPRGFVKTFDFKDEVLSSEDQKLIVQAIMQKQRAIAA